MAGLSLWLAASLLSACFAALAWWLSRSPGMTVVPSSSSAASPSSLSDPSQESSSDSCRSGESQEAVEPPVLTLVRPPAARRLREWGQSIWPFGIAFATLILCCVLLSVAASILSDCQRHRREQVADQAHMLFLLQKSLAVAKELEQTLRTVRGD